MVAPDFVHELDAHRPSQPLDNRTQPLPLRSQTPCQDVVEGGAKTCQNRAQPLSEPFGFPASENLTRRH
jgi:hypothetical protein